MKLPLQEMMESLRMQHAQNVDESTASQPIDEWKLHLDAVGGKNKKNIIYGLGSSQSIFYGSGKYQNNASGSSQCDNQDHQNTQTQLQEMKNLVKSMQEEHENQLKAMESRLAMMFEARTNGHSDSPPDADLDGHSGDNQFNLADGLFDDWSKRNDGMFRPDKIVIRKLYLAKRSSFNFVEEVFDHLSKRTSLKKFQF